MSIRAWLDAARSSLLRAWDWLTIIEPETADLQSCYGWSLIGARQQARGVQMRIASRIEGTGRALPRGEAARRALAPSGARRPAILRRAS